MKSKLLLKLRKIGRGQVSIYSVTSGTTVGMSYGYNDDAYADVYHYGDTREDVKNRAARIYLRMNLEDIRKRYKRYSRKYNLKQ